jgi:hypothetical protein
MDGSSSVARICKTLLTVALLVGALVASYTFGAARAQSVSNSFPIGLDSGTATATATPTGTVAATATGTVTQTRTPSHTPTPGGPEVTAPLRPGDSHVNGSNGPNRTNGQILICLVGGPPPPKPAMPPCTSPDSKIGMCGTNSAGTFVNGTMLGCPLTQPLMLGQCIYAYDTVSGQTSPVECATAPSPAPALSPPLLAVGLALLGLIAAVGVHRLRRG